jgi:glycosyltransferase involved in cell wall biosynthesis
MTPRVSVVMPVRDGARWLSEAIRSILDQTLSNFELIIIDDGSTDNSHDIIKSIARGEPRIRAMRQDRQGLVAALNCGLSECRGPLIARLDADDRAHPLRLRRQAEYLDCHPDVGLLGTWANQIDEHGSIVHALKPPTNSETLRILLTRTNPFVHSSVMLRTRDLRKVGFYRQAFEGAEDYDLWIRISEHATVANLPEYLVDYRWHPTGLSHRLRVRQLYSARLAQEAALARRANTHDPTEALTAAPNWHEEEFSNSPAWRDLSRLFKLLQFADSSDVQASDVEHIDISVISDGCILLNHAERRLAQLALLNIIKRRASLGKSTSATLLWHFVRLHPFRAARLMKHFFKTNMKRPRKAQNNS